MEEKTCSVGLDDGLVGENFIDEVRMAYIEECREIWKDLNKRVFGNEQRKCNGTVGAIQRLVTDMQMANVESNAEKTRKQQPMNK
ncbi:hypothetical protein D5086_015173 [Populus alba]|uniref:Uncharacterized protein n=1 Tax=Populus alba TaxID=43335 RepID=A0ACC4C0A8_POPAL